MAATAKFIQQDHLGEGSPRAGYVVLNYGDPAYQRQRGDDPPKLERSEAIFLRVIAYLAFVDGLYVPARYVLQGDDMWRAMKLAEPLIRAGVVVPERRAEAASFEDLAAIYRMRGDKGARRGAWLDEKARQGRTFQSLRLGEVYQQHLLQDLDRDGGLQRAMTGPAKRALRESLPRAQQLYGATSELTPEAFADAVGTFVPAARPTALRWAMARYYITPTAFDNLNTREMPRSAARLLVRGGELDPELLPMEIPAPADSMYQQLIVGVPCSGHVSALATKYCEAVLEVRERIPHARGVFRDIRRRAELEGHSQEIAALMSEELARQEGLRPRAAQHMYTLGTSVATALGGALLGADPVVAVGAGVTTGFATEAGQGRLIDRIERRRRPWPVMVSRLGQRVPG